MKKPGIYIHIPFCKSRCSYCDFATDVYRNAESVERYVSALCREIQNSRFTVQDSVETLYFGGGTPSLLTADQLGKIINALSRKFSIGGDIEFTLEMNPATVTLEKLRDFRGIGVNRASFGIQTFDDRALKILARGHNADDARKTLELLRKSNFDNISFDLIAGLPNQTLANWENNLSQALDLGPEHLSLYLLEIHEDTPLAEQIRSKRQPLPDEDLAAEMYEMMLEKAAEKGYLQYEISNFSRPNFESRHNSKYWFCDPVVAFGVSAHSFDGTQRWANERDTRKYVRMVESGQSPIIASEKLSDRQLSSEFAFLNLRMTAGLDLSAFKSLFNIDIKTKFAEDLKRLEDAELVEFTDDRLKLTRRGMVYSNEVFSIFV